jgi:fumarate hydratase subunit alpha
VFFVRVGTQAQFSGNVRQAIADGFDELVATIRPPLLPHVTNPLTNERGYKGRGMPIVTFDLVDGADHVDITCSPKALGSGRWAALEIFSFPDPATIEKFVIETVIRAGSQPCPPVVIGVGIGGSFDYAAKLAKEATLRPVGEPHPEPMVADMERRLLAAVNKTGFGPMGTGGDSTAMAVHVSYAAGHGFTPVAVCFNCWINRRTRARIYNDGRVETVE